MDLRDQQSQVLGYQLTSTLVAFLAVARSRPGHSPCSIVVDFDQSYTPLDNQHLQARFGRCRQFLEHLVD